MKKLCCWRCKMEIPMLNEDEFAVASKMYSDSFRKAGASRIERFKPLLDYYEEMTGYKETEPNAIMHHRISQYGPTCKNCGKPYRTPQATLCPACGNKRKKTHNTLYEIIAPYGMLRFIYQRQTVH